MTRALTSRKFRARIGLFLLLTAPAAASGIGVSYSQLPLSFQAGGSEGRYLASGSGYRLSLLPGEARLDLSAGQAPVVLRMVGANPAAAATALAPLPGRTFYLRGRDPAGWRTNVLHYGRIRYRDLYPGIDLVFYGNQNELEYDFLVAPGADLRQVRLEVSGARPPRLDSQGDAVLTTGGGEIRLRKPILYQMVDGKRHEVGGSFQLLGRQIRLSAGTYDPKLPLVIDPVLTYATYLGRNVNDQVNAIALGPDGSSYVAGIARAATRADQDEAFVAHLSADGKTLLYMTYLGGSGASEARGIAVDSAGNAYLTGRTAAADFPVRNAVEPFCDLSPTAKCSGDAFVARLDPDGSLHFATFFGGTGTDAGNAIAVDSAGDVYVAGATASVDLPIVRAVQPSAGGEGDGFAAKISGDGSHVLYATYLGGTAVDEALGIAVDAKGNAYVSGRTASFDFPVRQAFQARCAANPAGQCAGEAFVTKLAADGASWVYSTYLGGSGGDRANAIAVDADGQAHVAGMTLSDDFPVVSPVQARRAGKSEAFAAGLAADGSGLLYATYLGGAGNDAANSIALDGSGLVYVGGHTDSADFPLKAAVQAECGKDPKTNACTQDAFVAVLGKAGAELSFSTYLGGTGADQGNGIAVEPSGLIHLGGASTSSDFPSAQAAEMAEGRAPLETRAASRGRLATRTVRSGALVAVVAHVNTQNCSAGVSITWKGTVDLAWTTAGNWSPARVPISTDTVCIGPSYASSTITIDSPAAANQTIANLVSNASINLANGSLTVAGTTGQDATFVNNLTIGSGATLELDGIYGSTVNGTMTLGGYLVGEDNLTIGGLLTWQAGGYMCADTACGYYTYDVPPITRANGGITTSTTGSQYLFGRELDNAATATFKGNSGSTFTMDYGSVVKNQSGATWKFSGDSSIGTNGTGDARFYNSGLFVKSTGSGTSYVQVSTFGNAASGTVQVSTGSLALYNPGVAYAGNPVADVGTWTLASGTNLLVYGGSDTTTPANIGGAFTGGTVQFVEGVTNVINSTGAPATSFTGAVVVDHSTANFVTGTTGAGLGITKLTLSNAAVLGGTDTIHITNSFYWNGNTSVCTNLNTDGSCQPLAPKASALSITVNAGATLTTPSEGSQYLWDANLVNAGTASCSFGGSTFNLGYAATLTNTGTLTFAQDCGVDSTAGNSTFLNSGTLTKTVSSGEDSPISPTVFTNTGTVQVNTGTLAVSNPVNTAATGTGAWIAGTSTAGAVLKISSDHAVNFGGAFSGIAASTLQFFVGSLNVTLPSTFNVPVEIDGNAIVAFSSGSPVTLYSLNLMGGGYVSGTDTVNITNLFTWNDSGGLCSSVVNGTCPAGTGIVNAYGGIDTTAAVNEYLYLSGRTLNNYGVATFKGLSGSSVTLDNGATVNNQPGAIWNLTGDSSVSATTAGGTFNNNGTFEKTGGTSTSQIASHLVFVNAGTVSANSGRLDFQTGYYQNASTGVTPSNTFLNGGIIRDETPLEIEAGTVTGGGTVTGTITNTAGTLAPGTSSAAGTITISSYYIQRSGGTFNVKILGSAAGQYDVVSAGKGVTLAGTLNVTLPGTYVPAVNDSFTIVSGSITGAFTYTNFPALPAGREWQLTSNANSVVLMVVAVTGPAVTLNPTALKFADTPVGQSAAAQFVTLTNSGTTALTIASIQPTGTYAADYKYVTDVAAPCPLAPAVLASGAHCTLDIVFAPLISGALSSGTVITVTDNSGGTAGATQTVGLTGSGLALASIAVSADSQSLAAGATEQFQAIATYGAGSDTATADVTSQVTWASSAQGVATISPGGLATAVAAGQTNISAGLNGITSNSFPLTVTAQSSITVSSGSGQSTAVGTAFGSPLVALVRNGSGNPISGQSVTFTAPASGASGAFSNAAASYTTTTNASGLASAAFTANATAGSYQVTATATGISGSASFSLTNTVPAPLLSISKSHSGSFSQGQNGASYTVVVSNASGAGPTSSTVTVTDTLPAGMTMASVNGGSTWNCSSHQTTATCTTSNVLAAGSNYAAITVNVNVAGNASSPLVNQVSVSGGGNSGTATANDSTTITQVAAPALTVVKSHTGTFTQGQTGTYTVVVSNSTGAGPTSGTVTVTDTLPGGMTIASVSGGATWTCTPQQTTATCTTSTVLPGGSSYPAITVTVNVAANATSPLVNSVSVAGGSSSGASANDSTTIVSSATANTVTVPSATGVAPGGAFSIPVTLNLANGVSVDTLTFALQISAVGTAPALTVPIGFTPDSSITPAPVIGNAGTNNVVSVFWLSFTANLSGSRVLGTVTGTVPASATAGQTYTVAITGADATTGGGNTRVSIASGPAGTLTVGTSYLVGNVYPFTGDMAPNFGTDGATIDILDVVQLMFAVNNVSGFVPRACSDRFDAMDTYPVDTTVRGGDGSLDIRDLIREMFRASGLDTSRPTRVSRGACTSSSQTVHTAAAAPPPRLPPAEPAGALVLGTPEPVAGSQARIPVYLEARRDLLHVALTFALGDRQSPLSFVAAGQAVPTLAPSGQNGVAAVAWLQGVSVRGAERLLLGYVVGPAAALPELQVYGISAVRLDDDQMVPLDAPRPAEAAGNRRD